MSVWSDPFPSSSQDPICFPESSGANQYPSTWALGDNSSRSQFFLLLETISKVNNTGYHYIKKIWLQHPSQKYVLVAQKMDPITKSIIHRSSKWKEARGHLAMFLRVYSMMSITNDSNNFQMDIQLWKWTFAHCKFIRKSWPCLTLFNTWKVGVMCKHSILLWLYCTRVVFSKWRP